MSQIMSVLQYLQYVHRAAAKKLLESKSQNPATSEAKTSYGKYVRQQPNSLNRTGFLATVILANRRSLRSFVSERNANLKPFVRKWPSSSLPQNFPRSLLPSSLHESPYVGLALIGNQHTWSTVGLTSSVKSVEDLAINLIIRDGVSGNWAIR